MGQKRGLYLYLQRIAREGFPRGEEGEDLIGDARLGFVALSHLVYYVTASTC